MAWCRVAWEHTEAPRHAAQQDESKGASMMFYLVNLSERTIEHESNTRAGCVTSRRNREISDALTTDAYAQRIIVTGLSRDEVDDLVQTDAWALHAYAAEGGR